YRMLGAGAPGVPSLASRTINSVPASLATSCAGSWYLSGANSIAPAFTLFEPVPTSRLRASVGFSVHATSASAATDNSIREPRLAMGQPLRKGYDGCENQDKALPCRIL